MIRQSFPACLTGSAGQAGRAHFKSEAVLRKSAAGSRNLVKAVAFYSAVLVCSVSLAQSGPATVYENYGIFSSPPQIPPNIDATTFINDPASSFIINFTNLINFTPPPAVIPPFEMQNTYNFSNFPGGTLLSSSGFFFDTYVPSANSAANSRFRAANFYNAGDIETATTNTFNILSIPNFFVLGLAVGGAQTVVDATNIVVSGSMHNGFESLLSIRGDYVDLSRSQIDMEKQGFSLLSGFGGFFGIFGNFGGLAGDWGLGFSTLQPPCRAPNQVVRFDPCSVFLAQPYSTPEFLVTNRDYSIGCDTLFPANTISYINVSNPDPTQPNEFLYDAIIVGSTNFTVTPTAFFNGVFGATSVQLAWPVQNPDLSYSTNTLYLEDDLALMAAPDPQLVVNGFAGTLGVHPTYIPNNYNIIEGFDFSAFLGPPAAPTPIPQGFWICGNATNQYTAYQALLTGTTQIPAEVAHQTHTNLPGRIEIKADGYLDLSGSIIASLNYLLLQATNHFASASGSAISSPWVDLNLRSTNGLLAITNVLLPYADRPEGFCNLYSARWTNVFGSNPGITNIYHVFFVDANFNGTTPTRVENLNLHSTTGGLDTTNDNLVVSDVLSVSTSFNLNASRLTITSNPPPTLVAEGAINLLDTRIVWSTAAPRLRYLTNNGSLTALNTVFFGGSQSSPYVTNFNVPYAEMINSSAITNFGSRIWAWDFQDSGSLIAQGGSVFLQDCQRALISDAVLIASNGAVSLAPNNLFCSNSLVVANGPLTLSVTNIISDGVPSIAILAPTNQLTATLTNGNFFQTSYGINLLNPPGGGDLLGSTVTSFAPSNAKIPSVWAARDLGPVNEGFFNDAGVGRLVLDAAGRNSLFTFAGAGGLSALYVDQLVLRNYATNQNSYGFLTAVTNLPNMRIYYGQALFDDGTNGTRDVSEDLDFVYRTYDQPHYQFHWLRDYDYGYFSSTNAVFPGQVTNRVNTARYLSKDLPPLTGTRTWSPSGSNVPTIPAPPPFPPELLLASALLTGTTTIPATNSVTGAPQLGAPPSSSTGSAVPAAFTLAQGSYVGLFSDSNGVAAVNSGYVTAKTTPSGSYSGKLLLDAHTYSFGGQFDSQGYSATTASAGGNVPYLRLQLQFDMSGSGQLTGLVKANQWTAQMFAQLQAAAPRSPASYTLVVPPDRTSTAAPAGYSFGTLNLAANNTLQFKGTLADGMKITQSSALSTQGYWPLYVCLYGGNGCLIGWVQLNSTDQGDLVGQVLWIKPAGLAASYTKNNAGNFTNDVEAIGSVIVKAASGSRLFGAGAGDVFTIAWSGGSLAAPVYDYFTLAPNNRLSTSSDAKLNFSFDPGSGLFSGKVPGGSGTLTYQGALFGKGKFGAGFFIDPKSNVTGQVYLRAP
ncbi:MAG: hypothetical protein C5B50_21725 [Verrucomicrobia bacterium]|nr:MAG: hypothetical protein C5B50_21725 [Verrucomicrobiota bacterium]